MLMMEIMTCSVGQLTAVSLMMVCFIKQRFKPSFCNDASETPPVKVSKAADTFSMAGQ